MFITPTPLSLTVRRMLLLLVAFVVVCAPLFMGTLAHAQTGTNPQSVAAKEKVDLEKAEAEISALCPATLSGCVAWAAYEIFFMTYKLALMVGGMLNWAVQEVVFGMGILVGNMTGVIDAWETLRDLANVFLVFLMIFIGIATIVGISGYGYKQLLFRVILAAILVNFSITFAKVIIDVSNLAAGQVFKMIVSVSNETFVKSGKPNIDLSKCIDDPEHMRDHKVEIDGETQYLCLDIGIASAFMSALRITTLFNPSDFSQTVKTNTSPVGAGKIILVSLLGCLLFIVLSFVMGAALFMLLGRFVILVFIIIVSPIAFVMWITGIGRSGSQWWHTLLAQSFVAPAVFLMWWISLKVLITTSYRLNTKGDTLVKTALGTVDDYGIIFSFAIGIGMLVGSLILAQRMGAYGASAAVSKGRDWSRKAGYAVAGGAGYVAGRGAGMVAGGVAATGRKVVGGTAQKIANSQRVKNLVGTQDTGMKGWAKKTMGRALRDSGKAVASSNFDVRSAPILGSSKLVQKYGGKAQQGGYAESVKQHAKKMEEETKWLGDKAPTSEDKQKRDAQQREVIERQERTQNRSAETVHEDIQSIETTLASLRDTLAAAEQNLAEARLSGTNEDVARETANYDKAKSEFDTVDDVHQGMVKRQTVRHELATGLRAGTEEQLTESELTERRELLTRLNNDITADYGAVNTDVKALDDEIAQLKKDQATATESKRAQLEAQIKSVQSERNTMVSLVEASREMYDMQDAWKNMGDEGAKEIERVQGQMQAAKTTLTNYNQERSREIDKKWAKKWDDEGAARVDTYLTRSSTERTLGFMPTPDWKRETAMRLRKPSSHKQLLTDLEKWFKEKQKSTNETPTPPAATPPATS